MRLFTKTTMVALAIVVGATASSMAQEKSVRFDPVSKDVYQLTYLNEGPSHIRVELIDEQGTKLLSQEIHKEKSLLQPLNLSNIKKGAYIFKVIDDQGEFVTRVVKLKNDDMEAAIKTLENDRAKIIVKGEYLEPVYVNVFDRNDVLLFDDYIERERAFTRVYDLSKLNSNDLRIEVASKQKILAAQRVY